MKALSALAPEVRQYLLVTGNYWAFTLTDGALRMLVVLHFHALGYSPLQIAALFLFYELFGVITNLVGGYLGARLGLNRTMNIGLGIQVAAVFQARWVWSGDNCTSRTSISTSNELKRSIGPPPCSP